MHCKKNLARVRMSRSKVKVKVTGGGNEKVLHFVWESFSAVQSSCGILLGAVLGVAATPVGKSAHAV